MKREVECCCLSVLLFSKLCLCVFPTSHSPSNQCNQMLKFQSCPTVSKSCLNYINISFNLKGSFQISPKVTNLFWDTIVGKFVAKNFKKRPIWSHWFSFCYNSIPSRRKKSFPEFQFNSFLFKFRFSSPKMISKWSSWRKDLLSQAINWFLRYFSPLQNIILIVLIKCNEDEIDSSKFRMRCNWLDLSWWQILVQIFGNFWTFNENINLPKIKNNCVYCLGKFGKNLGYFYF